ncbi:MAG: methylmalonyl-CoA epimerase [Candidatus Rokubacteria bacterium]|nr:methylmalonyl-CoA epimerase [Candidatus Rokubacteria bacterium]
MKIKRIEHVGIVVSDLDGSRRLWENVLGIHLAEVEHLEQHQVRIAMYPIGESMVELLAGTAPDSKYARLAREGRAGLHHICLEVEDIDGALAELRTKGVPLLDETPRPGHQGSRIAFLDPAGTGNVLVELVELPGKPPTHG